MKLGWRNPRPNDFQGLDERPIRDVLGNQQKFLTWPHIQLGVASNFNVTSGSTVTVSTWNTGDDPYNLHASNSSDVQVPQDFEHWLVCGGGTMASDFGGGAGQRRLEWLLNGAATQFRQAAHFSSTGVRLTAGLFLPVKKADVLALNVINSSGGTDSTSASMTLFFLPMA